MTHLQDSSHVDIRGFMYFPFNFIRILMTMSHIVILERMVLINFLRILNVEEAMTLAATKVLIHLLFTWIGVTSFILVVAQSIIPY